MKIKKSNIYLIEWIDSYHNGMDWEEVRSIKKPKNMYCYSVGWIIKETEDNIVIVGHISDIHSKYHDVCGKMIIPKVAIKKRIKLTKQII